MLDKIIGKVTQQKYSLSTSIVGGVFATLAIKVGSDFAPDQVTKLLSETANNEIARAGFFFIVASWIHSGRVKKEIKLSFTTLTDAINNVATSLREDLKEHLNMIHSLDSQVKILDSRVTKLDGNKSYKEEGAVL